MLQLGSSLIGKPVLSLRTGRPVAVITGPIINPNNLKIEAWYVQDKLSNELLILLYQDIREVTLSGVVINDHEVLAHLDDLVRLQEIVKLEFELQDKPIISENRKHHGKVGDYAFEIATMYVQKLYVTQSLLRNLGSGSLTIDREQIVEITSKAIVIKDPLQPIKSAVPAPSQAIS